MHMPSRTALAEKLEVSAFAPPDHLDPVVFRRRLVSWYRAHARALPWRGTSDPYKIWVSEVMLQQTRVAAVIEHFDRFLRRLPGIGEYTCAAIASIAFGESVAVVDGNVERVLLRLTGKAQSGTAECKAFVQRQANMLIPPRRRGETKGNAAGDHNQAMME